MNVVFVWVLFIFIVKLHVLSLYVRMYLQAFVNVVAHKGSAIISLPLYLEALKGLVKALVKRSLFYFESLPYLLSNFVYL